MDSDPEARASHEAQGGRVAALHHLVALPARALLGAFVAMRVNTPFAFALGGAAVVVITLGMYALSPELRHMRALVERVDAERLGRGAVGRAGPG